ncbi:hypothetical protein AURDEDRAFT_169083 [Auricularia subglabra TFB-10046 SS5]|nr:hypothetical protein AURDEDRAFT_169083 [Auricularia subglabra TFB-10046 SS5]
MSPYPSTAVELPDDVVSHVFDELRLSDLILASHVCRRWRCVAHNHQRFWGVACISKDLTAPAVDFFLARLAQAQRACRPVAVTIWPSRGVAHSRAHLSTMRTRLIPAITATLAHITALHIEVPPELAECMFDALRQPAPALRSFAITSWKDRRAPTLIPPDIFRTCAPQLTALTVANGVHFPDDAVPAFHTVERLKFLRGCPFPRNAGLGTLLEWFPRLRDLDSFHQTMTEQAVATLTTRHHTLDSLALDVHSLMNIRTSQNPGRCIASIRTLDVNFADLHGKENPPPVDPLTILPLMPQASQEMCCWMHTGGTNFAFLAKSGPSFVRRTNTHLGYRAGASFWVSLSQYTALVALSIDIGYWDDFRYYTAELPALEVLHIDVQTQLPRQKREDPAVPCPCLRTVLFRSRADYLARGLAGFAVVTCRGIDEFLRTSIARCIWSSVEVLLLNINLYGPHVVHGTLISEVRMSSTEECVARGAGIAMLLMEYSH